MLWSCVECCGVLKSLVVFSGVLPGALKCFVAVYSVSSCLSGICMGEGQLENGPRGPNLDDKR